MIPTIGTSVGSLHPTAVLPDGPGPENAALREAAEAFETVFLTEMLSHAGMGATGGSFGGEDLGGGVGEEAFSSLLTREWADRISRKGGLGLSDAIYESLLARGVANG